MMILVGVYLVAIHVVILICECYWNTAQRRDYKQLKIKTGFSELFRTTNWCMRH